ncbi:MAG: glycosyltransferase family 2 protein [Sneathiella sp.]
MTTEAPEVTIGMPVYNAGAYLAEALESLLSQSFADFEIVVSDNCSTDNTREIVEVFAERDDRVRLIRQKENIGAMANFGALLGYARGKYFMWRSYDDWSDPNYIAELYKIMTDNSDCALAVPGIVRTYPDKTVSGRASYPDINAKSELHRVKELLKYSKTGWLYGLFRLPEIQKAFKAAFDGFPHIWAQDNLILLPFLLNNQVQGTNNTTFYQRETGNGDITYRPKSLSARWELVRDFYDFSRQCLSECSRSSSEKRQLFWPVIRYTNDRSEKFKKIIRPFLLWPVIRPYEIVSGKKTGKY